MKNKLLGKYNDTVYKKDITIDEMGKWADTNFDGLYKELLELKKMHNLNIETSNELKEIFKEGFELNGQVIAELLGRVEKIEKTLERITN